MEQRTRNFSNRTGFRLVLGLAICAVLHSGPTLALAARPLTLADDGSSVELKIGQVLVLELEGNPTTGFDWHVRNAAGGILQVVSETSRAPGQSRLMGAPSLKAIEFKAVKTGSGTLTLAYFRSWEGPEKATRHFAIRVTITP